ncbi:ABC transporter permease subunit [Oceanobacillus neutriphilus]|uniref:Peptide ABC transporter permease n=1 Tax=Oceanobacillus neutriphilus TaxID=531815 RepID=A0ABQ2NUM4_9BACI|nr:ABC transporter permease subunit [Oceanobacillus neutriphilus]GGP10919.1 peptide ABC transporter permease [Oceanobacillus neutriphilus]
MGLYYRIFLKFILTAIGIVLISALPALFDGMKLDISSYISTLMTIASGLMQPFAVTYEHLQTDYFLFPDIWPLWGYSMTLLFVSFIIAFLFALILTFISMIVAGKLRKIIRGILFIGESVPDILVIGLAIMTAILVNKHTNLPFFSIASFGDKQVFILPIIVLTILPTVFFYRSMMYDFEEEISRQYIDVAKSKRLSMYSVLFIHVFRNAIIHIFLHSKSIIWFMLSNLLMIEYAFNIDGLMRFMFMHRSLPVLAIGLLMMFIPIYMMQAIGQIVIEKITGKQVEV